MLYKKLSSVIITQPCMTSLILTNKGTKNERAKTWAVSNNGFGIVGKVKCQMFILNL